jgi:hypothetical protein
MSIKSKRWSLEIANRKIVFENFVPFNHCKNKKHGTTNYGPDHDPKQRA